MREKDESAFAAVRARVLLSELLADPVARRRFRSSPALALTERGFVVPAPPGPLVVRIVGVSVYVSDEDLLGRPMVRLPQARAPVALSAAVGDIDVGLLLCVLGARPMALFHAPEEQAENVAGWLRGRGFAVLLSHTAFEPLGDSFRGGFADGMASAWSARAGSGGWRGVLVSRNPGLVAVAWLAMVLGWDDYLGVLLGYPSCCSAAFQPRWAEARRAYGGDVARVLLDDLVDGLAPRLPVLLPWPTNSLARVVGATLPVHFPCRTGCSATERMTRWHLQVLAAADPARAARTMSLLQAPAVVGPSGEVHALVGGRMESAGWVVYDPAEVCSSTNTGALAALVSSQQRISAQALIEPAGRLIWPQSGEAGKDSAHAVPFFSATRSLRGRGDPAAVGKAV